MDPEAPRPLTVWMRSCTPSPICWVSHSHAPQCQYSTRGDGAPPRRTVTRMADPTLARALKDLAARGVVVGPEKNMYNGQHPQPAGTLAWRKAYGSLYAGLLITKLRWCVTSGRVLSVPRTLWQPMTRTRWRLWKRRVCLTCWMSRVRPLTTFCGPRFGLVSKRP